MEQKSKKKAPNSHREYTVPEAFQLMNLYPVTPTSELAEKFGRTTEAIYQFARRYELVKDPAYHSKKGGRPRKQSSTQNKAA